jgi:hypothetical protein
MVPLVRRFYIPGAFREHPVIASLAASIILLLLTATTGAIWNWWSHRNDVVVRVYTISQTADVGEWRVTAKDLTCGFRKFRGRDAQGQFCALTVTVLNRGTIASPIFPPPWTLHAADGERYPLSGAGGDAWASPRNVEASE